MVFSKKNRKLQGLGPCHEGVLGFDSPPPHYASKYLKSYLVRRCAEAFTHLSNAHSAEIFVPLSVIGESTIQRLVDEKTPGTI